MCVLSRIRLFATPWTVVRQTPPWNFPGKNTGVGCRALLQGIVLIQAPNPLVLHLLHWQVGCPGGTSGKEPACQLRRKKRCRLHPWVGKISLRSARQPLLQYSCLENHMGKGAWQTTVQGSQRVRNDWGNLAQGYKRTTDYWIAVQLQYQRQNWKPKLNASTVYSGSWKTQECTVGTVRYLAYIPCLVTYSESSTQPCFTAQTLNCYHRCSGLERQVNAFHQFGHFDSMQFILSSSFLWSSLLI